MFEFGEVALELADLGVFGFEFVFEFLVKALDGSESDAIGIDGGDGAVVFANVEGGVEILSGGADVADGFVLGFVVPGGDGESGDFVERGAGIHRREVFFDVVVTETRPGAGAGGEGHARGGSAVGADSGDEADATGGADRKFIVSLRGKYAPKTRVGISPNECPWMVGFSKRTRS